MSFDINSIPEPVHFISFYRKSGNPMTWRGKSQGITHQLLYPDSRDSPACRIYAHCKTTNNPSGAAKVCKKAFKIEPSNRTGEEVREVVARLVMKLRSPDILVNHSHYISILPVLQTIPGVVKLYDQVATKNKRGEEMIVYYQERYERDLLSQLMDTTGVPLHKSQRDQIALICLNTLRQLHQNRIYHRDVKIDNVLVDRTKMSGPIAVLCDFDFAWSPLRPPGEINRVLGTLRTFSPERVQFFAPGRDPSKSLTEADLAANDVWGMGLVLYALYHNGYPRSMNSVFGSNQVPYQISSAIAGLSALADGVFPEPSQEKTAHVIWNMLQPDPLKRINASQALHQFDSALRREAIKKELKRL